MKNSLSVLPSGDFERLSPVHTLRPRRAPARRRRETGSDVQLRVAGAASADGSSFLRGDDLELFSASLRHERAQVQGAIQEYEARMLLGGLAAQRPTVTRIKITGGLGLLEQPGALQTWSQPWEQGGVVSMFQKLLPDPQLQLFTYGGYTEQQSVVFGTRLEPIGLAA